MVPDSPTAPDAPTASSAPDVLVAVLAAGGGTRFTGDSHKLLAHLPATGERPAEPVVGRALAHAKAAHLGTIVVVTGAIDAVAALDEVGHDGTTDVSVVHNARWDEGQATSVRCAIDAARVHGVERVVIGLADQPGISPDAWRRVATTEGSIVVATYDGRRGNPVALQSDVWNLLPGEGDEGARSVMRLHPELVVEVPCSGSPHDIDTTEDLRRWQNNSSTNSP